MSLHCIVWCCRVLYCWLRRAGCISQDTYLLYNRMLTVYHWNKKSSCPYLLLHSHASSQTASLWIQANFYPGMEKYTINNKHLLKLGPADWSIQYKSKTTFKIVHTKQTYKGLVKTKFCEHSRTSLKSRKVLFVHSVCANFGLDTHSVCTNFSLNTHSVCTNFSLDTHSVCTNFT